MKYLILFYFLLTSFVANSQDCSRVRRTSKKKAEIQAKGGDVTSKDFYYLLIQKHFDPTNPNDTLNFSAMLTVASRYELTDSVTNSLGTFDFELSNGQIIQWKNAKVSNLGDVIMGVPNSLIFTVQMTKEQLEPLSVYLVQKLRVFHILETKFEPKKQKQLLSIVKCLINEE
jgi:hypothetical protein